MPRFQSDPLLLPYPTKSVLPSAPIAVTDSLLSGIWQTICRIAFKIFSALGCSRGLERLFNSQEILLLKNDKQVVVTTPNAPPARKIIPQNHASTENDTADLVAHPSFPRELIYVRYDDTLEQGRQVIREVSSLALDIIHEKSLAPMIDSLHKMAPSIPPIVKSTAKLLIEMGDKAAKPLLKKLAQHKTEVIEPAMRAILKTLIKTDSSTLRGDLFKFLQGQMQGVALPPGQKSLHYIQPILKRLFPNAPPTPIEMAETTNENLLDAKLMEELFAKAQTFLRVSHAADLDRLYNRLLHRIGQDLKDVKIPKGQDLTKDYLKPILDWLVRSDLSTPIANLFIPSANFDENLIDKIFEMTTTILVEKKIDHYVNFLDETLQHRLGDIIRKMILVNTVNIADYFSGRFAEMMTHFPYTETFDKVTHQVIAKHLEGFIAAKEAVINHKRLLGKSHQAVKLEAYSPAENKAKSRAEKHLASVELHGGEEQFLQHMFLEAFSQQRCCNPNVLQIIEQLFTNTLQSKDPKNAIHAIEQSFFATLADEIMGLMLPSRRKRGSDGVVEEIEAVVELWNQLYLPPEFLELMKHVTEITNEYITPDTSSLFASIKEPLLMVTQKFAITLAQDILKKKLVTMLQKCFELITNPTLLSELSAESILPAINEQILRVFFRQEFNRNVAKIAPFFLELMNAAPSNRDTAYKKLQEQLQKIAMGKFKEFQGKNFHITEVVVEGESKLKMRDLQPGEVIQLITPFITEIEQRLAAKKQEPNHPALDLRETTAIIKKFFEGNGNTKTREDIYGEIVMNFIFKIGGWKNENLIGFFIKDSLSRSLTNSTADLRSSYHFLFKNMFQALRKVFLSRPRMERMLGAPSAPPKFTMEKLKYQIDTLSRLVYDMISELAGDKGIIAKFSTKKFIHKDSTAINELITKIYHEMLGNKIVNQNMLMQVTEEIFQGFRIAAQTIRAKEGVLIQKAVSLT